MTLERSAQNGFNKEDLAKIRIIVPPSDEQHRIVAKLEKLLAKVDKCKERLEKIPAILKRFRQSVLAAACSGVLTGDWRNRETGNNSVSEILEKIKTPSPKDYLNTFHETSDIEIPLTWRWFPLGKLGKMTGGGTPDKSNSRYWSGSIPWVSPKDMKTYRIRDSIDHINDEALSKSSAKLIPASSILFVVRGMILNHTLPVAITEKPVAINQDMKALVPEISEMGEYILIAARYLSKKILFAVKEATHGTRRIESQVLHNWAVPVPPMNEQKEVVNRVEGLFKIADEIETRYVKAAAHVDKLTQSILTKAFRGELVPQDPNDEPASELLKRITAEREQTRKKGPKVRKTGKPHRKRKKAIQASNKNHKPEKVEKHERKEPSLVLVEKEAIAQKAKRKPLEAPTGKPLPLVDLDQLTIMAAFRKACRNRGEISRADLLKTVASSLGYQKLSAKLRVKLQGDMRAAMMRGIIQSNGEMIVPATQSVNDYDRDDLIKYACSVTKKGKPYEQDSVIRDTLKHLGFQRTTGRMRKTVISAIRNGIRKGLFVRDKGMIFRP